MGLNAQGLDFIDVAKVGDVIRASADHECVECRMQFGQITAIEVSYVWIAKCWFPSLDDHYFVREEQIQWLFQMVTR